MTFFTGEIPNYILYHMIRIGSNGPCEKSKRVSAIYTNNDFVIAVNSPPYPYKCSKDEKCKKDCNQICVHAEESAIMEALYKFKDKSDIINSTCVHLKIIDGQPVTSGNPSCIYCSRKLLHSGVQYMWLWQETGWKRWTTLDFHRETIANLGLNGNTLL